MPYVERLQEKLLEYGDDHENFIAKSKTSKILILESIFLKTKCLESSVDKLVEIVLFKKSSRQKILLGENV